MYTKLFGKILTSSVWTYDHATRIVWITLLAAMDEDGFAHYATVKSLAAVAQVSMDEATAALQILEQPDPDSSNTAHDGRRIEKVPGGWLVLNAAHYRQMQRRTDSRAAHAERMRRYRARKAEEQAGAGKSDACVMPVTLQRDGSVMVVTAHTDTEADTDTEAEASAEISVLARSSDHAETGGSPTGDRKHEQAFQAFWTVYPRKTAKATAAKAYAALRPSQALQATILAAVRQQAASHDWQKDGGRFVPHAATWLRGRRWEDVPVGAVAVQTPGADPSAPVESAEDREHRLLQERTQVYIAEQKRLDAETKAWRESPDYVPLRELFRRQREAQGLPPLAFLEDAKP